MYLKKKKTVLTILLVMALLIPTIIAIIDSEILNYILALPAINILLYLYNLKDEEKKK